MRAVLLLVLLLSGCDNPFAPDIPGNAVAYDAPTVYAQWWGEVQTESGLSGSLDRVRWHEVNGGAWYSEQHRKTIGGLWKSDGSHRIFMAEGSAMSRGGVQHEMLHDLIGGDGDPGHRNPLFYRYDRR